MWIKFLLVSLKTHSKFWKLIWKLHHNFLFRLPSLSVIFSSVQPPPPPPSICRKNPSNFSCPCRLPVWYLRPQASSGSGKCFHGQNRRFRASACIELLEGFSELISDFLELRRNFFLIFFKKNDHYWIKMYCLDFYTFRKVFISRYYPFHATCPWNGGRALPALLPVFLYSKVSFLKNPWQFSGCFLFLFKMFDQLDEGLYFGFLSSGPKCKISHWDQCEDNENIKN
jgi:hypothetical protein